MLKFIIGAILVSFAVAQSMGNGISKSTWGSSDPTKCLNWFLKYLPTKTSSDSCPNSKCECAT